MKLRQAEIAMASSINHDQEYQEAQKAYIQGNYEEAGNLVDHLVQEFPDNPHSQLLRGHIYCVLGQYDLAQEHYQTVLNLTQDPELIECAHNGLESVSQYQSGDLAESGMSAGDRAPDFDNFDSSESSNYTAHEPQNLQDLGISDDFDPNGSSFNYFDHNQESSSLEYGNSFGSATDASMYGYANESPEAFADPFTLNPPSDTPPPNTNNYQLESSDYDAYGNGYQESGFDVDDNDLNPTLLMAGPGFDPSTIENTFGFVKAEQFEQPATDAEQNSFSTTHTGVDDDFGLGNTASTQGTANTLDSANFTQADQGSNIDFMDQFGEVDDLGDTGDFIPATEQFTTGIDSSLVNSTITISPSDDGLIVNSDSNIFLEPGSNEDAFAVTSEEIPVITETNSSTTHRTKQWLRKFEDASLERKQWFTASAVGVASAVVVAAVGLGGNLLSGSQNQEARHSDWAMPVAAGVVSFATTRFLGQLTFKSMRRTTRDLQAQFAAVRQGNLNAQATIYSKDEFGQLATGFNEMAQVILKTTSEAQREADEQEQAKEQLQRQVMRLLDDVEGAARGDLTVRAEVSADVLGAVADSFNLTIQSLREIVQQVKTAARQVSKGATDSETFAQALSSDALRQAEELAVTLNSVQVMTDAIQRVAESAREAEVVARTASATAEKGGEAVERTVAGILEIRQTVAETTRKVKRLAESSQEISKIVALISQIASRTNLLALNASIEAARAGEAGRGFAIIADEVRQLADRIAKALKEIEQVVRQIQTETGSVMTAMEEGTQQVIQGTHLAEQAKRSLEDIVQVSNRIDTLVRSITAETVEQTETSQAVASVMQSVELTAQGNSQEAQRVSGSLQNLVGVAGDLLTSVERFRVETNESM